MVTRTWIGGNGNQASNQNNWNPKGKLKAGDSLQVSGNPDFSSSFYTMNVTGNDLVGNGLQVGTRPGANVNLTANLSHQAIVTAGILASGATFNLSQNSTLTANWVGPSPHGTGAFVTVNISGNNSLTLNGGSGVVNLAPGATWNGTFNLSGPGPIQQVTVNGGTGSAFNNNGASTLQHRGQISINTDVIGSGNIQVAGSDFGFDNSIQFLKSVGANQSVQDSGLVKIDQPNLFAAKVFLGPVATPAPGTDVPLPEIDLNNLARADSYTFQNDLLNVWSGDKVIDTLRLHDNTQFGFEVDKTASGVNIVAYADATHTPIGTPLPIHMS